MGRDEALSGRLLVAGPQLADPNFRRTVVLVLQHGEEGAFGVVLNRPLPVEVSTLLPGWESVVSLPPTLFQGGPVGLDGALGLVTMPRAGSPPDAVDRLVGPFGVVDLDAEPEAGIAGASGVRIFVGHAGWTSGQLEQEVAAGDWYVLPAEPTDATTPLPDGLWRQVLRRQGGALAIVSTFSEDPSLN